MNKVESTLIEIENAVNNFGRTVYNFRMGNSLSLQTMAQRVSISASYLWRIENDKRKPELDVRKRILTLGMNWSTVEIHLYLEKMIAKESV